MEIQANRLTDNLRAVLERAQRETAQRHGVYVDVEHLLLGLLEYPRGAAYELLRQHQIDPAALYERVAASVGVERSNAAEVKGYTRAAREALGRAGSEAMAEGAGRVGTGHLLASLMDETQGAVHDTLAELPLTVDEVSAFTRAHAESKAPPAPAQPRGPRMPNRRGAPASNSGGQPEIVLIPTRKRRQPPTRPGTPRFNRTRLWIGIGIAILAYLAFALPTNSIATFAIVLVGWIFSLTLHEFSHALVAYLGGDTTVREKGYLSFNPLKYTDPLLSIGLPLLFLALGGIGLPGGAVYIERHRLRSKWWGAAVSAAGPASNALLAIVLSVPFALDLYRSDSIFWSAMAFLAMLQVTAVVLNILPIPPFDGFGILEPLLDEQTRFQLRQFGRFGIFLIFVLLWFFPPAANAFWDMITNITHVLHIPSYMINEGFWNFMFWRNGS